MDIQKQLLVRIEAFVAARKITETTFGLWAVNDGKFVRRLRDQNNMTTATLKKAAAYLDAAGHPQAPEAARTEAA